MSKPLSPTPKIGRKEGRADRLQSINNFIYQTLRSCPLPTGQGEQTVVSSCCFSINCGTLSMADPHADREGQEALRLLAVSCHWIWPGEAAGHCCTLDGGPRSGCLGSDCLPLPGPGPRSIMLHRCSELGLAHPPGSPDARCLRLWGMVPGPQDWKKWNQYMAQPPATQGCTQAHQRPGSRSALKADRLSLKAGPLHKAGQAVRPSSVPWCC